MINKTQKKALLKSLGSKHIKKIQLYAAENGFVHEDGQEYSRSTFSNSFNGSTTTNLPVENIIFEAAEYYRKKTEQENLRRKDFVTKTNKSA
jgi:hypothetical protein